MATAQERKRHENRWELVLNSQEKIGPMNQREDYAEAINIKEDYKKKLKDRGRKSTPVNKFDNEQISRFLGAAKDLNVLTKVWLEVVHSESINKLIFVVVAIIRHMVAWRWDEQ